MSRAIVAIFKGPQQTKEAIEEIQGESLANSKISVAVRSEYLHQGSIHEEIADELAFMPPEINLDKYNAWLVQAPPIQVPNLGEVVVAGPLAYDLLHHPHGQGFVEALLSYGLSEDRARHYEHEIRTGHYFVLIETEHEKVNSVANCLQCYGGRDIEKWKKEINHPLYPAH